MELDQQTALHAPGDEVRRLYDAYQALNQQRIDLDRAFAGLPAADPERDRLWQELEGVMTQIPQTVWQLASVPSSRSDDLQAKAAVGAHLLRQGQAGAACPHVNALLLSILDDVAVWSGSAAGHQDRCAQ